MQNDRVVESMKNTSSSTMMGRDGERGVGSSRLFVGNRALGCVSNHIPIVTRFIQRRREHLVVTCVGRVFHTYGCSKLGLLSVSKAHPEDISCIAADSFLVFAASGGVIYAWRRGHELKHVYGAPTGNGNDKKSKVAKAAPVVLMLPFGPHLISVDAESTVRIWDIKSEELYAEMEFQKRSFEITAIAHLPTYHNKILFGSAQGTLQLWNVSSLKRVHTFAHWTSSVTAVEAAPAINVAVVGFASGDIVVHNVLYDETIVKFRQDWGPVSGLAFRTDGQPVLVSSSTSGHLALWDLQERKLAVQMRDAHRGPVTGLACLAQEPLMLTSSPDNTLKQWIFDLSDGGGRLLRLKEGHGAPPTRIRFYGALGKSILSAGEDSTLRSFSTVTDLLNKSFGVASYSRKVSKKHKQLSNPVKMPPITDFTAETTRDRDWSNVVCVHRATAVASTWSFGHQRMNDLKLIHKRFKQNSPLRDACATCLCLSICGNFVVIGYDSGHVDRFNVQSGLHRGSYVAKGFEDKEDAAAHPGRKMRAVCTDGLNQLTITADHCGGVKFWRFDPMTQMSEAPSDSSKSPQLARLSLEAEVLSLVLHRDSALLCAALADLSLNIIDVTTRAVARRFASAHAAPITDACFSADSRWVVSASLDKTVKVWDVPTGHLVDRFRFASAVTSLSLSPTGEYLATAHAGHLGVFLWTNVSLYQHVPLKAIVEREGDVCPEVEVPLSTVDNHRASPTVFDNDGDDRQAEEKEEVLDDEEDQYVSPNQLSHDLVTLANLPSSRWTNLLDLDVIKGRNKPKNPVQKPKNAPFFLPTISGLETKFDLSAPEKKLDDSDVTSAKPSSLGELEPSPFGKALMGAESDSDMTSALALLREKGPAAVEVELRSLSPDWGGSLELCRQFLAAAAAGLRCRADFEAVEAHLALFLKLHGDLFVSGGGDRDLVEALEAAEEAHQQATRELNTDLAAATSLAAFCRNVLV